MKTKHLYFACFFFYLFLCMGCQSCKHYHDTLIETSLVSEIPTLMGNLVGGVAGVPVLLISAPIAHIKYPDVAEDASEEERKMRIKERKNCMISPMQGTSIFLNCFGLHFYPFALAFPENCPMIKMKSKNKKIICRKNFYFDIFILFLFIIRVCFFSISAFHSMNISNKN